MIKKLKSSMIAVFNVILPKFRKHSSAQILVFDHWSDDETADRIRTLTIGEATTITAHYRTS